MNYSPLALSAGGTKHDTHGEHYTRNTETATAWCNKCIRVTQHRVDGGRRGPCLEHQTAIKPKKPAPTKSGNLFEERS